MPEHQIRDTASWSDEDYQQYILQGVSRTFALTIPQLPDGLELSVGNAYLLCRIADTIEDSAILSAQQKREFAGLFIRVVRGSASPQDFSSALLPLLGRDVPAAELDLLRHTDRVIRITRRLGTRQQLALSRCVTIMLEGMAFYQGEGQSGGLEDIEQFNSYCYHVAGVVGEMLTELYCDYSETINQQHEVMMDLAVSFGQGLQMTNILKDIWEDDQRGVCWLPESLLREHGIDPRALADASGSVAFAAMLDELIAIAHGHLRNALEYTLLIPVQETGIRRFCLWALGMAVLTLQRLHRTPSFSAGSQAKISRRSVRATMLMSSALARWNGALRLLFRLAAQGLPCKSVSLSRARLRVSYHLPAPDGLASDGRDQAGGVIGKRDEGATDYSLIDAPPERRGQVGRAW